MRKNKKQYIEVICYVTGEKFLKEKKEYDRQVRNGCTKWFKTKEICNQWKREQKLIKEIQVTKKCEYCGKEFSYKETPKRKLRFCSRACGNKNTYYNIISVNEDKKIKRNAKISFGVKLSYKHIKRKKMEVRKCVVCLNEFVKESWSKVKTCSRQCFSKLISEIASNNPNCGGETNYKRYRYNNILMDSQWEVDIAIWLDTNNIKWVRDKKIYFKWIDSEKKEHRYHPDFYLPEYNLYLDPKNKYLIEKDRYKIEYIIKEYNLKIIWGLKENIILELNGLTKNKQIT